MSARTRQACWSAVALTALVALCWHGPGLLYVLPAVLGLLTLLSGRYPGERVLVAAIGRHRPAARPRSAPAPHRRRAAPRLTRPRGGALLGSALAGRGPPALVS